MAADGLDRGSRGGWCGRARRRHELGSVGSQRSSSSSTWELARDGIFSPAPAQPAAQLRVLRHHTFYHPKAELSRVLNIKRSDSAGESRGGDCRGSFPTRRCFREPRCSDLCLSPPVRQLHPRPASCGVQTWQYEGGVGDAYLPGLSARKPFPDASPADLTPRSEWGHLPSPEPIVARRVA